MMGLLPAAEEQAPSFSRSWIERQVPADHLLRQIDAVLDLSFVLGAVRSCYGRSGPPSLDPRVLLKMMLLLFLYDLPSERQLIEQIRVRLDFLWFLGFTLETPIPDASVLSKARARWGPRVFEGLFAQTVAQCVQAGLVGGRLLHVDSTMVKAHASKDSVVAAGPELVSALRQACQEPTAPLQVLPASAPLACGSAGASEGAGAPAPAPEVVPPVVWILEGLRSEPTDPDEPLGQPGAAVAASSPPVRLLPPAGAAPRSDSPQRQDPPEGAEAGPPSKKSFRSTKRI